MMNKLPVIIGYEADEVSEKEALHTEICDCGMLPLALLDVLNLFPHLFDQHFHFDGNF